MMAGIESLSGFMSVFALNLADHPDARRELVKNPALIPDAVEESLRFNTSAQRFRRILKKDVELHGQTMKEGDFVALCYGAGNRDERKFEQPDQYNIHRKPKGHLGFGGGVHACLGTSIARLAIRVAYEEFLPKFQDDGHHRTRPVVDWSDTLDENYAKSEARALIAKALDQLKPVDKTVVVLSDLEGLSDKEIAAATGLTVSAVKTRLHRARLFLRGKLAVQLGYSAA